MPSELMRGRRGLIMGLANDKSIAWGIARVLHDHGAELAFSYQGEALLKRVTPLAAEVGSDIVLPCDVADMASMDALFEALAARWGRSTSLSMPSASRTRTSCAAAMSIPRGRTS
ncbi:Enoyl-[acyl-carrier-protein] reductase (NADH) [Rubellimicrobium thermophilum DSM 16684]|uniref:Enoyl-[acyl-carrier-protein] reductase (NADH) n=1 Tax=Rubellimicrobium thermophilum DSM 16684 TaxID=1123069 RepID=S9S8H7_9RHOB|nr:Enoyl-[acyl-carrier-protein] reductase (NADH) [Rubellimicrobium thermophilum DSM 16684]